MKSLRELYRIGRGPSSSHTMGPEAAARLFLADHPDADFFRVTLYGSLASTGRGHLTDRAVADVLGPERTEVIFDTETDGLPHPNTMEFTALRGGEAVGSLQVLSVGGGAIRVTSRPETDTPEVYPEQSFAEIAEFCKSRRMRLWQYVELHEGPEIWEFLFEVWSAMKKSILNGLTVYGELPGGLQVERRAQYLYDQRHIDESQTTRENRIVCAYAFAVAEENAGGGTIVTAPTCGSCGVVPAALSYMQEQRGFSDMEVLHALAAGGVIGNLVKTNASISGAECGCQAEIGTACSMCAAALAEMFGMGFSQIECAAEVAMEHYLGLTCDPICGLVQIPCIERNAVAAMRAINALSLANFLSDTHKISFDTVVKTMYETGRDLHTIYRETSRGGLAKIYHPRRNDA